MCKNGSTPDTNYQCSDGEHPGLFYCSDKSVPSKKISPKQTTPILVCADGTLAKFRSVSTGGQNNDNIPQGTDGTTGTTGGALQGPPGPPGPPGPGITEIPDGSILGKKLAPDSVYTNCNTQKATLAQKQQQLPIEPQQPPQQKQQQQNNNQDNNLTPGGPAKITKQNAFVEGKENSHPFGFIPVAIGNQPGGSSQTQPTCASKLADNAVINSKIADNAVDSAKIANDAVNSLKIKDGAVTSKDIINEAIDTSKLKDGSIITNDIGDRQVTLSKLGSDVPTLPKVTVVQQKFETNPVFQGLKTFTVRCPEDKVVAGGGYVLDDVYFFGLRDSYPDIDLGGIGGWSINVYSMIGLAVGYEGEQDPQYQKVKGSITVYAVCLGMTPQPVGEIPVIK